MADAAWSDDERIMVNGDGRQRFAVVVQRVHGHRQWLPQVDGTQHGRRPARAPDPLRELSVQEQLPSVRVENG